MIAYESRQGRRIVGRLERGGDLEAGLLAVCREHRVASGELRGLGSLETVELAEYDQAQRVWKPARAFAGGFEILNLTGNVSERGGALALHAHVSLMRDRDSGIEMIGGHLVKARVFALEFVIEAFDDLVLRRAADAATGLTLWNDAIQLPTPNPSPPPPPSPSPSSSPTPTWADVVKASPPPPPPPEEPSDDQLQPGDVILHPTFGRCEVQRLEGGYEFAHVRLKNGRLVRLALDMIKVIPAGQEDNRRIFRARVE